jgi:N-acetylglucosamine kinase-like BadF-type ATPase
MASLLLVESGSTKTDWCLVNKTGRPVHFKTSGINPYLQSADCILKVLENELPWDNNRHSADQIVFYGAGAGKPEQQQKLSQVLKNFFKVRQVEVQGDMMAAARAMCGNDKGIVCILGTGSNSCFYNGKKIVEQQTSLGFIAGDEGSGNYMGKRILQYYAYNTFDEELKSYFEMKFGGNISEIVTRLYAEPFPNRYLATFVTLLKENRGHFMVENIIEDCLNDFFHYHILKYRQSWKLPLFFTGSVAREFEDIIRALCQQYELEFGKIEKSPMENLIKYHRKSL